MPKTFKIAFIYIDEIHHLYHFITMADWLSRSHQISILTFPGPHELLDSTLKELGNSTIKVEKLSTMAFRAFTDKLKAREFPRKGFWMKKNKDYILSHFDAIVFTDYIHQYLLKKRNGSWPKFIKSDHGTAGRKYAYKKDILDFDFNLLFGRFYHNELKRRGLLTKNHAIVGYPKLDAVREIKKKKIFTNNKPTVLYSPHFSKPFSSWHSLGLGILDFFYHQKKYNLLFAPHIHLFQKGKGDQKPNSIPQKYFAAEHLFFDYGSEDSVNMTYINNADIYLGDVSSQVYEFMISPRPCIFLNPEKITYQEDANYRFWRTGEVICTIEDLGAALEQSNMNFKKYKAIQQEITEGNYDLEAGANSSKRAADAIIEFLRNEYN